MRPPAIHLDADTPVSRLPPGGAAGQRSGRSNPRGAHGVGWDTKSEQLLPDNFRPGGRHFLVGGHAAARVGVTLEFRRGAGKHEEEDGQADVNWLSAKLSRLRIFDDEDGVMNRSVVDVGGDVLAVSQFTLFASVRKGSRPSWSRAARPEISRPLLDRFVAQLESELGRKVPTGVFGADMQVHLVNDGPVTIVIDSKRPE